MKTITFFACLLLLLLFPKIKAQELITASGGNAISPTIQLDYTLGDLAIRTGTTQQKMIKEGFLQPTIIVQEIFTEKRNMDIPEIQVSIFPNPTVNYCRLIFSAPFEEKMNLRIYTLHYELIRQLTLPLQTTEYTLNLHDLSAGTYILRLEDSEREYNTTYRIIKVH